MQTAPPRPKKKKRKAPARKAPTPPRAARPEWRSWAFSVGTHGVLLAALMWFGGFQPPVEATSEPIELVTMLTDAPLGDGGPADGDRAAPKETVQRVTPEASEPKQAERSERITAPKKARTAAPAHAPTESKPDLDALMAEQERKRQEREADRIGKLASAADDVLGRTAGTDTSDGSPLRGGAIDTGSGLSGDIGQRRILEQIQPSYPETARRTGSEGDVRLRVWVAPEGRVSRVEVVRLSGTPEMDKRAVEALKRWKFAPLPEGGSVTQWGEITLRFRLE